MKRYGLALVRVVVWMLLAIFGGLFWLCLYFLLNSVAHADAIAPLRWQIETSRPASVPLELVRGETVYLAPQYMSYGAPMDLSDVYEVVLRYRDTSLAAGTYYAATGTVSSATNGEVRVMWTPAQEAPASSYTYTIAAKSLAGDTLRGFGTMKLLGSVMGNVTNQPHVTTTFDWSAVEHINPGDAPFLTGAELMVLERAVSSLDTAKVDRAEWILTNAAQDAVVAVLSTGKVDRGEWASTDAAQDAAIAAAAAAANMGGDVTGVSSNASVVAIRSIPVSELFPGAEEDGYGLKYDHSLGALTLGPVASTGGGTTISNLLLISGTASLTDVPFTNVGVYRTMRPGNLPSAVVNVGGAEVAYFDLLGMTLRVGSLHLLSANLTANPAAYDGDVGHPAYTWASQLDLGKYRMSYGGGYGEGYTVKTNLVWFWAEDGVHIVRDLLVTNQVTLSGGIDLDGANMVGAELVRGSTLQMNFNTGLGHVGGTVLMYDHARRTITNANFYGSFTGDLRQGTNLSPSVVQTALTTLSNGYWFASYSAFSNAVRAVINAQ